MRKASFFIGDVLSLEAMVVVETVESLEVEGVSISSRSLTDVDSSSYTGFEKVVVVTPLEREPID